MDSDTVVPESDPLHHLPTSIMLEHLPTPVSSGPVATTSKRAITKTYGRKQEPEAPAPVVPLVRHSTVEVPETEEADAMEEEEEGKEECPFPSSQGSSASERHGVARPGTAAVFSSPGKEHSTDPTSEEEERIVTRKVPVKEVKGKEDDASSEDGDMNGDVNSDGDDEDDTLAFFKTKKSVADLMKDVDDMSDDEVPVETRLDHATAPSSTLPPLTTSEAEESTAIPSPGPLHPEVEASSSSPPVAESAPRKVSRTIVAPSDSDSDSEPVARKLVLKKKRERVIESSEKEEGGEREEKVLTKREKMEQLAAKKRPKVVESPKEVEEEVEERATTEELESSGEESKKDKKGKGKKERKLTKGQSKKAETEMNSETAALQRAQAQHIRLPAAINKPVNLSDILKKAQSNQRTVQTNIQRNSFYPTPSATVRPRSLKPISQLQPSHPPPPPAASSRLHQQSGQGPVIDLTEQLTSSDTIEPSTQVARSSSSSHREESARPQDKGKGREKSTPGSSFRTPAPSRTAPPVKKPLEDFKMSSDEEGDELLDLNALLENHEKEEEEKKKAQEKKEDDEKKASLLRSRKLNEISRMKKRANAQGSKTKDDSDSDSDLEIIDLKSKVKAKERTISEALSSPRYSKNERKILDLNPDALKHVHDEDVTESQIETAGRTYGTTLGHPELVRSAGGEKKKQLTKKESSAQLRQIWEGRGERKERKKANGPTQITGEALSSKLAQKARVQNLTSRIKRQTKHYRNKDDGRTKEAQGAAFKAVDFNSIQKEKERRKAEMGEEVDDDEDADDDDYQEGGDDAEDEYFVGQADDEEMDTASGSGEDNEDDLPASEGITDDLNPARATSESSSVDKEIVPAALLESAAIVRVEPQEAVLDFGGNGEEGEGFSQFFGSPTQLATATQFVGFRRAATPTAVPELGPVLIGNEERQQDAARIAAQNNFGKAERYTPAPAPREYINKHGLPTQNYHPDNLLEGALPDTPLIRGSVTSSVSRWAGGSEESQLFDMTQTQLDDAMDKTPLQLMPRDPTRGGGLTRVGARLLGFQDTFDDLAATKAQPAASELASQTPIRGTASGADAMDDDDDEEEEETEAPSAAQPLPNAFDALKSGALRGAVAPPVPKRRVKNDFINDEANLSDDEYGGMGAPSDDENEEGEDGELAELVDHSVVDEEIEYEQDQLAGERYQADQAAEDARREKIAQDLAAGKKRKNGRDELSDEDFDDDTYGMTKRDIKRTRVENDTIAALANDEDTQAFAAHHAEGLFVPIKDIDFLLPGADRDQDSDDEGQEGIYESDTFEQSSPAPAVQEKITTFEVHRRAVELTRAKKNAPTMRSPSPDQHLMDRQFSSPDPLLKVKINDRLRAAPKVRSTNEDEEEESQYSVMRMQDAKMREVYSRADNSNKEESQGSGSTNNGTTAGLKSAVTSFATNHAKGGKSVLGGTLEGGKNGKAKVVDRKTSMSKFKKNAFA